MTHLWLNQRSNISVLCEEVSLTNTMQFRKGQDPSTLPWQLVMMQISLVNTFKILIELLLKPIGRQTYIPQIMSGVALGPSFLSQSEMFYRLFVSSAKGLSILGVFRAMGFMFLLYLLSMRIDVSIMKKCGKLAVWIGISTLVVPLIITTSFSFFLQSFVTKDVGLRDTLPSIATLVASTSFHVILVVLTDLKLLNSELGRLAIASSMISGISSWVLQAIIFDIQEDLQVGIKIGVAFAQFSKIITILIIVFVFRPIMLWMERQTPDGKPLKEPYICSICLMILVCALFGEVTGQHFYFAPVIMGMATPDGPPVVPSLMEKLDCFVETVLVPCYVIDAGRRTNIFLMKFTHIGIIQLLMFVASFSKLLSVIIPAYYFKMPFLDALSLGFILNCKGLFDVQMYSRANKIKLITNENYAILVISSAAYAGLFSTLTRFVYDPSRRYIAYRKHTVQHSNESNSPLRIVACIHHQDNVPAIVNILEESNPRKEEPVEVYVMNLKQSALGTVPLLIPHQPVIPPTPMYNKQSEMNHIMNAFSQIENRNEGLSMVQYVTSYAPHRTLHDAVCSMALGKSTSLILVPFLRSDDPSIRIVNKNVLLYAPCSVGILYDGGKMKRSIQPIQLLKRVCVVFLGGQDDCETLAFGARMARHPGIKLTVIRLVSENQSDADLIEKRKDMNMINEFKLRTENSMNPVTFEEYRISQVCETARLLRSQCKNFEIILVGRRHDPHSSLLVGLSEWKEVEELGVIGDMLASKEFDCPALLVVIQQQASVVHKMIDSPKSLSLRLSVSDNSKRLSVSDSSTYVSTRWS